MSISDNRWNFVWIFLHYMEKMSEISGFFFTFAYLFLPRSVEMTWLSTDSWQPKASNREPTLVIYEDDEKEDFVAYWTAVAHGACRGLRQTYRAC